MIEVEFWALLTFLAGLLVVFLGAAWGVIRMTQTQASAATNQRMQGMETALGELKSSSQAEASQWQRVDKEILKLRAELPLHYVRREDYVRGQTVIESKLDALATKLENVQLRGTL